MPNGEDAMQRVARLEEQSKTVRSEISELFEFRNKTSDRIVEQGVEIKQVKTDLNNVFGVIRDATKQFQNYFLITLFSGIGFTILNLAIGYFKTKQNIPIP